MDEDFNDLQRLLRLKRHEAPPPEYFEDFLFEFQRRQRAEMLKRSLWRLALDRFDGAIPNFSFPRYAYASASAMAVAAAVVVSGRIVTVPRTASSAPEVAVAVSAKPVPRHSAGALRIVSAPTFDFANSSTRSFRLPETDFNAPRPAMASLTTSSRPRYVLDTRPVSYAQSSSF